MPAARAQLVSTPADASPPPAPARIAARGELESVGPNAGFMVNRRSGNVFAITSYNPRRFADSRRRWAMLTREQVARAPATSVVTLTHRAEFHAVQIDRALIAHDSAAARLLVQRLSRLAVRIDAGDVCWTCLRAWSDRLGLNPRSPFRPCRPHHRKPWHGAQGNCAHCGKWEHLRFYAAHLDAETGELIDGLPRGAWLCSTCGAGRRLDTPTVRFSAWVREPGKSLRHLHRHALFDGPFVPQWLLSRLASAAGFGAVLDVRKYRHADSTRPGDMPLGQYLTKIAGGARSLDPLSAYFAKVGARPDEFNALPKGMPRKRAPSMPRGPSEWYFSRHDPRLVQTVWTEPEWASGSLPQIEWRVPGCVCVDRRRGPQIDCRCGARERAQGVYVDGRGQLSMWHTATHNPRPLSDARERAAGATKREGTRSMTSSPLPRVCAPDREASAMPSISQGSAQGESPCPGVLPCRPPRPEFALNLMTDPNKRLVSLPAQGPRAPSSRDGPA